MENKIDGLVPVLAAVAVNVAFMYVAYKMVKGMTDTIDKMNERNNKTTVHFYSEKAKLISEEIKVYYQAKIEKYKLKYAK